MKQEISSSNVISDTSNQPLLKRVKSTLEPTTPKKFQRFITDYFSPTLKSKNKVTNAM
jgi:hypothetical protein